MYNVCVCVSNIYLCFRVDVDVVNYLTTGPQCKLDLY